MNSLKLISLRFKNFKGLKAFEMKPNGNDMEIKGENASGKTTTFDGLTWLFFSKDSSGKSDFQLKPVDEHGDEIHNLDTEVEGTIHFKGKTTTLLKRFQEKWVKTHGKVTKEFTGHTIKHFIDDVPVKKKEYEAFISDIVDAEIFKLVTSPLEFNKLHWTDRRRILIEMCGDVSDQDIINSDSKLAKLKNILGDLSIEKLKKKIKAKQTDINKELELIPARIDEVTLSIKEIEPPINPEKKEEVKTILSGHEEKLRLLRSNEAASQKRVQVNEIKNNILKTKSKAYDLKDANLKPIREDVADLETRERETEKQIVDLEYTIQQDRDRNEKTEAALTKLREQFAAEQGKEVNAKTQCPACGQDLPEDEVEAAIGKFNQAKAEALKDNNAEGKKLKQGFDERQADINKSLEEITAFKESLKDINMSLKEKQKGLESATTAKKTVDVSGFEEEKEVLEKEIKELEAGSGTEEKDLKIRIEGVKATLAEYDKIELEIKASKSASDRITELEDQESTLAQAYEKLESELNLIDKFIVKKVKLLEDKINSKFKMATFRLFETQINSGINETCDTLYNGISFNDSLNSASKTNVGLDIINALSEYYGFQSVLFIDNKESINELIKTDAQVITLSVTKDKELTIA